MLKKNKRPIHLNLITIRFPITAIVSIIHRISGFFLFIIIGPALWCLKISLYSENGFSKIHDYLLKNNYFFKFLIWNIMIFFCYHIICGIRQIFMDLGYLKQTLLIGKFSAIIVLLLILLLSIYLGIKIWSPIN